MKNYTAFKNWKSVIAKQYIYNTNGNIFDHYDSVPENVRVQK